MTFEIYLKSLNNHNKKKHMINKGGLNISGESSCNEQQDKSLTKVKREGRWNEGNT